MSNSYIGLKDSRFVENTLEAVLSSTLAQGIEKLSVSDKIVLTNDMNKECWLRLGSDNKLQINYNLAENSWKDVEDDRVGIYQWSATTAYAVNDVVVYKGALYRCLKATQSESPANGSTSWDQITHNSNTFYVSSNEQLKAALDYTGADAVKIIITDNLTGSFDASVVPSTVSIYSDETVKLNWGTISITGSGSNNIYWHSHLTSFGTGTSNTPAVGAVNCNLYFDSLNASRVTQLKLSGNVYYQLINGTVIGGTQTHWCTPSEASGLVPRNLKDNFEELGVSETNGRIYIDDTKQGYVTLRQLMKYITSDTGGFYGIDASGLLQDKPTRAERLGYIYYATDTGAIYRWGTNGWSTGYHIQGSAGTAATIKAGATSTLDSSEKATVTNVGTENAAIFNFGIPKGEKGDKGDKGDNCVLSISGTETVSAGTPASVAISGTSPNQALTFKIPQGEKGAKGDAGFSPTIEVSNTESGKLFTITNADGAPTTVEITNGKDGADGAAGAKGADGKDGTNGTDGKAATIAEVTVTTGEAGTEASVENTGTDTEAKLHFTIPRGATGETGKTGEKGADGTSVTVKTEQTDTGATITLTDATGSHSVTLTNGKDGADGGYTLPAATTNTLGGIIVGDNLTIDSDGKLSATATSGGLTEVPVATTETVGGIKVAANDDLAVAADGTLSLSDDFLTKLTNIESAASTASSTANTASSNASSALNTANQVQSELSTHTSNANIHVPSSGTTGYVLTKTDSGSEWKAAQSSSSGTTTNVDAVEKLTALPETWTSDDSGRVFVWSTSDTDDVKQGHIYKVATSEASITISGSVLSGHDSITTIDGVYTPYKTGEVTNSDGTTGTGVIAYANADKSIFIFQATFSASNSALAWGIHTETKNYLGAPPTVFAYFTCSTLSDNTTYYTPNLTDLCDKTWSPGYKNTLTSDIYTFTKGTWAASEGSTDLTDITASASSGSSDTTTTGAYVEKLTTLPSNWAESDVGRVFLWNNTDDNTNNVSLGHIYRVIQNSIADTAKVSFNISDVTEPDSAINGNYTEYGKNQGPDSKYYTSYSNGTYYFIMVGNVQWWNISTTSELNYPSSEGLSIAASTAYSVYIGTGSADDPYKLTEAGLLALKSWSVGTATTKVTPTFSNYSDGSSSSVIALEDITPQPSVTKAYTGVTNTIEPSNMPYKITVADSTTLNLKATGGVAGCVSYADVTLVLGAGSSVSASDSDSNLTLADTFTAGKTHYCAVRWEGTSATLFIWRTV